MRVCLFEDEAVADLEPVALTRPAFALLSGCASLGDKQYYHFGATDPAALVRPALAPLLSDALAVNDAAWLASGPAILVNARWLPPTAPAPEPTEAHVGMVGDEVAYAVVPPAELVGLTPATIDAFLARWKRTLPAVPAGGTLFRHLWELVDANADAIRADAALYQPSPDAGLTCVGPRDGLFVEPTASIEPFAVADTRSGPVVIDREAVVASFSRLEGPCYVGPGTHVLGAKLRGGTTLGPGCRVGGEVEASIVQGFSNKYHDGFLGHAYVGAWVNLGAGTHNSDLRNDYGPVRVTVNGRLVATGRTKIGCFLGDHTKAGLGCLLNTGTSVGPFCGLLPTGGLLPRHLPPFTAAIGDGAVENDDVDGLIATAKTAMARRDRPMTAAQEAFYRRLFETTAFGRNRALRDAERRRVRRGA
ncbi:MAG: putative sugar nucleotidyl transferase [Gemmataceae bacterium]